MPAFGRAAALTLVISVGPRTWPPFGSALALHLPARRAKALRCMLSVPPAAFSALIPVPRPPVANAVMLIRVALSAQNFQVVRAIVPSVAVDVMDLQSISVSTAIAYLPMSLKGDTPVVIVSDSSLPLGVLFASFVEMFQVTVRTLRISFQCRRDLCPMLW